MFSLSHLSIRFAPFFRVAATPVMRGCSCSRGLETAPAGFRSLWPGLFTDVSILLRPAVSAEIDFNLGKRRGRRHDAHRSFGTSFTYKPHAAFLLSALSSLIYTRNAVFASAFMLKVRDRPFYHLVCGPVWPRFMTFCLRCSFWKVLRFSSEHTRSCACVSSIRRVILTSAIQCNQTVIPMCTYFYSTKQQSFT
jgi:hypothetical protein